MLIEPVEILLDKPRKVQINKRALLTAETEVNRIRGASTFGRVSIDYLMLSLGKLLGFMKTPFPLDLRASMLYAAIIREPKESLSFDDVLAMLDKTETPDLDIDEAILVMWTKQAGGSLTSDPAKAETDEKKTENPVIGNTSGASPESNLH